MTVVVSALSMILMIVSRMARMILSESLHMAMMEPFFMMRSLNALVFLLMSVMSRLLYWERTIALRKLATRSRSPGSLNGWVVTRPSVVMSSILSSPKTTMELLAVQKSNAAKEQRIAVLKKELADLRGCLGK